MSEAGEGWAGSSDEGSTSVKGYGRLSSSTRRLGMVVVEVIESRLGERAWSVGRRIGQGRNVSCPVVVESRLGGECGPSIIR
jgi:hypothetical protein